MKNYVRFGIWDLPEKEIPIKVDRHVIRISIGNQVTCETEPKRVDRYIKPLMDVYRNATRDTGISAVALDDAFWYLGARFCYRNDRHLCKTACPLECIIRPYIDRRAWWVYPQKETRVGRNAKHPEAQQELELE